MNGLNPEKLGKIPEKVTNGFALLFNATAVKAISAKNSSSVAQ